MKNILRIAGYTLGGGLTLLGVIAGARGGLTGVVVFVGAFGGGWLFSSMKEQWRASDVLAYLLLSALMMTVFHSIGFYFAVVFTGACAINLARKA